MNDNYIKNAILSIESTHLFSNLELLQILKVLSGYKRSARLLLSSENALKIITSLFKNLKILCYVKESNSFHGIKDRNKGGWTNLCSLNRRKQEFVLYIAMNKAITLDSFIAENSNDNKQFAIELSYPECCSEFFSKNFSKASRKQGDLFPFIYHNTQNKYDILPYLLNPLWYFDAGYIEYWPCSFRCPNALIEAQIGEKLIKRYLPHIAIQMDKKLKSPLLYTEYSGIFCFIDARYNQENRVVKYNPHKILATAKTKLFQKLQLGNQLCNEKGEWYICLNGKKIHKIVNVLASVSCFDNISKHENNVLYEIVKKYQVLGLSVPKTTEIDILMLLCGKKRALRLIINYDEYNKALILAEILNVNVYVSEKRVSVVSISGTGDEYIDYLSSAPKKSQYLICYAKTIEDAKACALLESLPTNRSKILLNKLLNYPICCVNSFLQRRPHNDWITPFLRKTPIMNWYPVWTNRLGYLFSGFMPLYDYEPCSAFCKGSLALAKNIKKVFIQNNIGFVLQRIINEVSTPIFLHDGILILMNNAKIKKFGNHIDIYYTPSDFQLKDYKLKPKVEYSVFWESNHMTVIGTKIILYKNDIKLLYLKQTQCNNRIFLFEE